MPGGYEITNDYSDILDTPEGEHSFRCRADEVIWEAAAREANLFLPSISIEAFFLLRRRLLERRSRPEPITSIFHAGQRGRVCFALYRAGHGATRVCSLIKPGACVSSVNAWAFLRPTCNAAWAQGPPPAKR